MSAALFLAKNGFNCTLIEKKVFPRDKICGDALSGKVISVLKHIIPDIHNKLKISEIATDCKGIKFISPNNTEVSVPFSSDYYTNENNEPSGFIMKRIDFDNMLYNECKTLEQITFIQNCTYETFEKLTDGYKFKLSNGETIQTKIVLCADGNQSLFARKEAKIDKSIKHHSGSVRAYFENVQNFEKGNFLELYFLDTYSPGYFWIFPLPNGQANVGLGIRSDYISKEKINLKNVFTELVTTHPIIKERLKNSTQTSQLQGFGIPLGSMQRNISGDHYLVLGDAAALVDPFTGEGIGNALVSGKIAAEVAMNALKNNKFDQKYLSQYDKLVYSKLGSELKMSSYLQKFSIYPWLLNMTFKKIKNNTELKNTVTAMFGNVDLRKNLETLYFI